MCPTQSICLKINLMVFLNSVIGTGVIIPLAPKFNHHWLFPSLSSSLFRHKVLLIVIFLNTIWEVLAFRIKVGWVVIYLPAYLPTYHLSISLPVCLSVYVFVYLPTYFPICLLTYQISNWPNCRGVCEGVFLSLIEFLWLLWFERRCQWQLSKAS